MTSPEMCGKRLQFARPSDLSPRQSANRAPHEPRQGRRAKGFGPAWPGHRFRPSRPEPALRSAAAASPWSWGAIPDCDVPLDGRAVSWEHAEIAPAGRTAVIRDLQSTNGVMVDGARVHEADLDEGALIRLGDFLGVVAPTPPAEQPAGPSTPTPPRWACTSGPVLRGGPRAAGRRPGRVAAHRDRGRDRHRQDADRAPDPRAGAPPGPFLALDCGAVDPPRPAGCLFGDAARAARWSSPSAAPSTWAASPRSTVAAGPAGPHLAEGRWERLGLVVGSQEPLATALADGRLCGRLYEQLDGVRCGCRPLRRRLVEIPALFRHLYARARPGARVPPLSTELVERLCLYDWPCNVREMVLLAAAPHLAARRRGPAARRPTCPPACCRPTWTTAPPRRCCPSSPGSTCRWCSTRSARPAGT